MCHSLKKNTDFARGVCKLCIMRNSHQLSFIKKDGLLSKQEVIIQTLITRIQILNGIVLPADVKEKKKTIIT